MRGKRIILGITGGIAAYKAAVLASRLTQKGADVRVIMTESATRFIQPLTLQILSRNHVAVDLFDEKDPEVVMHIDLADHADLVIIAPATANLIGKLAHGIADDLLTTTLLATQAPVVLAPAMNVHMYENRVVQQNLERLRELGIIILEPDSGQLACGYTGKGRMMEPEAILAWIEQFFAKSAPLAGKKFLITAGPTIEPLDPVRFISNHSSGKMGFAIAEAAREAGAEVVLVAGPVTLATPAGVKRIDVMTAREMYQVVMEHLPEADVIVKTAAVADYRPKFAAKEKIKKTASELTVVLEKNPDIALEVGRRKRKGQLLVGFAAETGNVEEYAREKLERKGMDLIVANNVAEEGAGFGTDTNVVTIYDREGTVLSLPKMSKKEIAKHLIQVIGERFHDDEDR